MPTAAPDPDSRPARPTVAGPPSRREFFRDATRLGVLAGLGAVSAVFAARGGPIIGKICPGAGSCGGCVLQPRCPSPTAALAKPKQPSVPASR